MTRSRATRMGQALLPTARTAAASAFTAAGVAGTGFCRQMRERLGLSSPHKVRLSSDRGVM
jgi:hypothetical protein